MRPGLVLVSVLVRLDVRLDDRQHGGRLDVLTVVIGEDVLGLDLLVELDVVLLEHSVVLGRNVVDGRTVIDG